MGCSVVAVGYIGYSYLGSYMDYRNQLGNDIIDITHYTNIVEPEVGEQGYQDILDVKNEFKLQIKTWSILMIKSLKHN